MNRRRPLLHRERGEIPIRETDPIAGGGEGRKYLGGRQLVGSERRSGGERNIPGREIGGGDRHRRYQICATEGELRYRGPSKYRA